MSRDRLFLLEPGFTDAARPGERFVCPDCLPIEGLLAADPARAARLEIVRVPFARPRAAVAAVLGPDNQGLPVLVLDGDAAPPADAHVHGVLRFVTDTRRILNLLAERHGFPRVH